MKALLPRLAVVLLMLLLAGCTQNGLEAKNALRRLSPAQWPLLRDDMDVESFAQAAAASLNYLQQFKPGHEFAFGPDTYRAQQLSQAWRRAVELRRRYPEPEDFTAALKREFHLYQGANPEVLMTGYYEPVLAGRLAPTPGFNQPLYAVPTDLLLVDLRAFDPDLPARTLSGQVRGNRLVPYPDREEIDYQGAITASAQPLAFIADPVEAFFMHIQGSGQIELEDGRRIRLGYAASNGRPYRSIGALLIKEGLLDASAMSMQAIQEYLARRPEQRRRILSANPSYVFFRLLAAEGGPLGAYSQPLTAGRSIACDRALFPPMALAFISGRTPSPEGGEAPFSRLVWAQDTGGAIKGAGRLDLFYGSGQAAGRLAGRMKYPGQFFFLAPKE